MAAVEIDDAALDALLDGAVARDLEQRAINVEGIAKRLLLMHSAGRVYTQYVFTRIKGAPPGTPGRLGFYGSRPPHQASLPGDSPNSDTGRLLASIHHTVDGATAAEMYADIGADTNYALFLELGTRYMAPRPFLRPALYAGFDAP